MNPSAKLTPVQGGWHPRLCARCRKLAPNIALAVSFSPRRVGVEPVAWICGGCQVGSEECLCCAQPIPRQEVMCASCQSDYEWALLVAGRPGEQ